MKKRIKTNKDIKIDEIIKLAGQVNSNNKKFLNTNDKYTKKQREKELDKYFKNFQREIVRDRNTSNIANDFHTWVEKKDKDGNEITILETLSEENNSYDDLYGNPEDYYIKSNDKKKLFEIINNELQLKILFSNNIYFF